MDKGWKYQLRVEPSIASSICLGDHFNKLSQFATKQGFQDIKLIYIYASHIMFTI